MSPTDKIFKDRFEFDPLYAIAILKVSNDLRNEPLDHMDDLLEDTLTDLELDPGALSNYVERHRESLEETCRRIGV